MGGLAVTPRSLPELGVMRTVGPTISSPAQHRRRSHDEPGHVPGAACRHRTGPRRATGSRDPGFAMVDGLVCPGQGAPTTSPRAIRHYGIRGRGAQGNKLPALPMAPCHSESLVLVTTRRTPPNARNRSEV